MPADPKEGKKPAENVPEQSPPGIEKEMKPEADHGEESYRGSERLKGRRAIITGGDSGIGRAIAIAFAREGADVSIGYYSEKEDEDAKTTARWVEKAGRKAFLHRFDAADPESCRELVQQSVRELGGLEILVCNAAYQMEQKSITDITPEQLEGTFRTNIFGHFYLIQAALEHLKKGSSILMTGSVTALRGNPALLDYSATKGAIHVLTKSLAQNLAKKSIRVNCVAPGPVWTPLIPATLSSAEDFGQDTVWERPAQPAEIAPAFVFLASDDARYFTGEILSPTGGETTR